MTAHLTSAFRQCDVCGMFTTRVHHTVACGTDTTACDECYQYDAEAYGEPLAEFLTQAEYNRDREIEIEDSLGDAMQAANYTQVANAILDIFTDADIESIIMRLRVKRRSM